jgi:uncharacterized OsmC-like protein
LIASISADREARERKRSSIMHIESIQAIRLGPDGVLILAGEADLEASIGNAPRPGTLDPIGLQLAAVAASLMRAIETTALARGIRLDGVEMSVSAERDGHDGTLSRIGYHVVLRSNASPAEIEALHELVRQGDEICAVIRRAIRLEGVMRVAHPSRGKGTEA